MELYMNVAWHLLTLQLSCPRRQVLTELPTQSQHLLSSAPPSSASHLEDFMNQADVLAKFLPEIL
eukprot:1047754-Pelagomonas_calceolata.AAC.1